MAQSLNSDEVDDKNVSPSSQDGIQFPQVEPDSFPISEKEISRIQRRIDIRIMPWACITYLLMRVDLYNVANAAIMNVEQGHGIKQELSLTPSQWNWVIACFFYTYGGLEPAFTLLMKRTRPSLYLGTVVVIWGTIACSIASAKNYSQIIAARVFLGAADAGFYPCVLYYFTFWFRPEELPRRYAIFYAFGQLNGFVGGFISFAVSFDDGHAHLAGWRWLFITEGVPAILLGFLTFYILPDYPQTANFLTEDEKLATLSRLSASAPSQASKTWDKAQVMRLITTPTFWSFPFIWFFHGVGGFGLSYVLPTVIFQLGFTTSALSNVLTVPPSICTFIVLITLGWLIEKRAWNPFRVAIGLEIVNIICYILLLVVHPPVVRYLCLVVASATAGSVYPVLWPSVVKSAHGTTAVALAIPFTNCMFSFSGILGPLVFSTIYGPNYHISFIVCIGLLVGAILAIATSGWFMRALWVTKPREAVEVKDAKC